MAGVDKVGAHGQGDAGVIHVDQAAFIAGGTINFLPFVKVLFQVEGVLSAGEADHRRNVGFAVWIVQRAACDHYCVASHGGGGEHGKGCMVTGHGQLAE